MGDDIVKTLRNWVEFHCPHHIFCPMCRSMLDAAFEVEDIRVSNLEMLAETVRLRTVIRRLDSDLAEARRG